MPEPQVKRSQLSRLLEQPKARGRVSRAIASLLAVWLISIAALGALVVWHLVRRGRMIRQGLAHRRPVAWPAIEASSDGEARSAEDNTNVES
jgi:hypothetical protein